MVVVGGLKKKLNGVSKQISKQSHLNGGGGSGGGGGSFKWSK